MTPPDRHRRPEAANPADPVAQEVDLLVALVGQRYGDRLSEAELADVRRAVHAIVEGVRALRAVRLSQADEPVQPFVPYRAEP